MSWVSLLIGKTLNICLVIIISEVTKSWENTSKFRTNYLGYTLEPILLGRWWSTIHTSSPLSNQSCKLNLGCFRFFHPSIWVFHTFLIHYSCFLFPTSSPWIFFLNNILSRLNCRGTDSISFMYAIDIFNTSSHLLTTYFLSHDKRFMRFAKGWWYRSISSAEWWA